MEFQKLLTWHKCFNIWCIHSNDFCALSMFPLLKLCREMFFLLLTRQIIRSVKEMKARISQKYLYPSRHHKKLTITTTLITGRRSYKTPDLSVQKCIFNGKIRNAKETSGFKKNMSLTWHLGTIIPKQIHFTTDCFGLFKNLSFGPKPSNKNNNCRITSREMKSGILFIYNI